MSEIGDLIRARTAGPEELRRITRRMISVYVVVFEDVDYRDHVLTATRNLATAWQVYRRAVNEDQPGRTVRIEAWMEHAERAQILVWHYTEPRPTTSELRQAARRRRRDVARTHRQVDRVGSVIASMPEWFAAHSTLEGWVTPF